jgi:hypothetical protein
LILVIVVARCARAPNTFRSSDVLEVLDEILSSRLVAQAKVEDGSVVPLWWNEPWRDSDKLAAEIIVTVDGTVDTAFVSPHDSVVVVLSCVGGAPRRKPFPASAPAFHATVVFAHVIEEEESLRVEVHGPLRSGTLVATAYPRFR